MTSISIQILGGLLVWGLGGLLRILFGFGRLSGWLVLGFSERPHRIPVMWDPPPKVKCLGGSVALKGFSPGSQANILGKAMQIKHC